jgi:hypothetical protein
MDGVEAHPQRSSMKFKTARAIVISCASLLAMGCAILASVEKATPENQTPAYTNLANQSIGVMVWTQRGTRADWPSLPIDLSTLIQDKLSKSTAKDMKGATFPVQAASIVRYQNDHPGIEATPITDVAPKLGVSRLIYVEIDSFSTRSEASLQMFRGNALSTLEVIETTNTQSKVAYHEADIRSYFPPKSAPEGLLNSSDLAMYRGTINVLADQIVNRLTTHDVKDE